VSYNYHQKHTENDICKENLRNKKVCSDFVRGIFDFLKYFAKAIQDLLSFLQKWLFKFPSSED
jgi:hypothetical protein